MAIVNHNGHTDKVKRAALYPRVSGRVQEEEGTSLGTQEARCRQHAVERGYIVDEAHIYREVHTGVELWERPQLTRLRQAIRDRAVDVVIAYAIDRLSRDPVHLGVIISEAEHVGVGVEFVTEPLDNSPEGQLIRFVRGYAAKVEHEKIKERTIRGRRARAEAGQYTPGRKVRYGYRWRDEKKTAMDLDDITAPVVKRMFTEAAVGRTMRQIAARLTADGIPTPTDTGNGWRHSSVLQILSDETYAGRAAAFRRAYFKTPDGTLIRKWRLGEGKILLPDGTVPPIVDAETFSAVADRLRRNQQQAVRNARNPESTLLRAGFLRCGHCGRSMRMRAGGRKGVCIQYWCSNFDDGFWRCDGRPTISARMLDEAVWARVEALLLRPDVIAAELEHQIAVDTTAEDLADVNRRITDVERRQRNLVTNLSLVEGEAANMVVDQLAELARLRKALDSDRTTVLAQRQTWEAAKARLGELEAWCRAVALKLGMLTYQEKRLALEALGVQVKLWRLGHTPRYEITTTIPLDVDVVDTYNRRCAVPYR